MNRNVEDGQRHGRHHPEALRNDKILAWFVRIIVEELHMQTLSHMPTPPHAYQVIPTHRSQLPKSLRVSGQDQGLREDPGVVLRLASMKKEEGGEEINTSQM